MLEILTRDGMAREARWSAGGSELLTPNILFVHTGRIRAFARGEAFLSESPVSETKFTVRPGNSWFPVPPLSLPFVSEAARETTVPPFPQIPAGLEGMAGEAHAAALESFMASGSRIFPVSGVFPSELRIKGAEVLVFSSASENSFRPRDLAIELARLKEAAGYSKLVYAPGLGEPSHIALLAYCGIDVFDSSPLAAAARSGKRLFAGWKMDSSEKGACHCPACERDERPPAGAVGRNPLGDEPPQPPDTGRLLVDEGDFLALYEHNCYAALSEVRTVRHAIRKGRLRELVESRLSEPWLVALLRHMDLRHGALLERFMPIARPESSGGILALSRASLGRPEVARFRDRVVHRYARPPSAQVLLLLPCSARKPYSSSLSHRAFRFRIEMSRNSGAVHEVVVTSPLGVVPLELESFYPAGGYDVPVTGDWDGDEMRVIREQLRSFVSAQRYDSVVCHLPGMEFLKDALPPSTIFTPPGAATSRASLVALEGALKEAVAGLPRVNRREAFLARMQALCRFQFGERGSELLEGCTLKYQGPNLKFFTPQKKQVGMILRERGLVSLTMDGGMRLLGKTGYEVQIGDFKPSSAIFAAGVLRAGKDIRPGDEVLAVHGGELRGVGIAVMSASEMEEHGKGTAIKLRHHVSSKDGDSQ